MLSGLSSRSWSVGDRIMKVAHAGEHGAVQIYRGQMVLARLTAPDLLPLLAEFAEHERRHRAIFAAELARRRRPRCTSYWLCGLGGWCLGFATGMLGRKAIAATTMAVERTVLRHLEEYCLLLAKSDPAGHAAVSAILTDEQDHHDAFAPGARGWASGWIDPVVAGSTEAVIWLGMRL